MVNTIPDRIVGKKPLVIFYTDGNPNKYVGPSNEVLPAGGGTDSANCR